MVIPLPSPASEFGHGRLARVFWRRFLTPSGSPAIETARLPENLCADISGGRRSAGWPRGPGRAAGSAGWPRYGGVIVEASQFGVLGGVQGAAQLPVSRAARLRCLAVVHPGPGALDTGLQEARARSIASSAAQPSSASRRAPTAEAAEIALQTGAWIVALNVLEDCGYLGAATGASLRRHHRMGRLRCARPAMADSRRQMGGYAPPRRSFARSPAGARPGPRPRGRTARRRNEPGHRGRVRPDANRLRRAAITDAPRKRPGSASGNVIWSPWSPRAAPTPRSPPSCTSASAPSAPTWTGSGTRPAAAAAPT